MPSEPKASDAELCREAAQWWRQVTERIPGCEDCAEKASRMDAIAARLEAVEAVGLYAVLWTDRHLDAEVQIFSDKNAAIQWAKGMAEESNSNDHVPHINDLPELNDTDYIAYFEYSCEGDNLRVMAVEVDGEVEGQ